jgi:hypothetical protein
MARVLLSGAVGLLLSGMVIAALVSGHVHTQTGSIPRDASSLWYWAWTSAYALGAGVCFYNVRKAYKLLGRSNVA